LSLAEPTLFPKISPKRAAATTTTTEDNAKGVTTAVVGSDNHLLWDNVQTMGAVLGKSISAHDGDGVLAKVEAMRKMARESWQLGGEYK
jgi:hypothetical protein